MNRVFYWVGLTVTQPFNTGVQRVTRCLAAALLKNGIEVIPVKWDESAGEMVIISQDEADHLAKWGGPQIELPASLPASLGGEWLFLPEITLPAVPFGSNVARLGKSLGMRTAAIFYDLIPHREPQHYTPGTLAALAEYWRTFASVDLALPISWTVRPDLDRWLIADHSRTPALSIPCLLSGELPEIERAVSPAAAPAPDEPFRLLAVGTWEPRKNYPRILRALKVARYTTGRDIRLSIVGRHTQAEFPDLHNEIVSLAEAVGPGTVTLNAHLSDDAMNTLFAECHATVFGSWIEGFGLPVLESLWKGRPCICHNGSSLAEIAPGGGALMLDMLDEAAIADGIARIANDAELFGRLASEAVERPLKTWDDYGRDVIDAFAQYGRVDQMMAYEGNGY